MPDRRRDPHQVNRDTRMVPRAFVSIDGEVHHTVREGTQTYAEIYRDLKWSRMRWLIAELPDGSFFATDMWATVQHVVPPPTVQPGAHKIYEDLDQAVMATVMTASNQPQLLVQAIDLRYGVLFIDERNLCHVKYR